MKTMTTNRNTMLAALCALLLGAANAPAQFNLLHSFAGGSDGSFPWYDAPTLSGSTLYGMTYGGGASGFGTAFKMNTNGTGFNRLHSFNGGISDGQTPYGSLTLSGSTLYGMTGYGGGSNGGTVFKMNTDGTGFALLHTFTGSGGDGSNPFGSLTLSGSTLYGMTYGGGDSGRGTAFKMNTDGTGFNRLHTFAGGVNDGSAPYGSLTLSGSTLYGMTYEGGTSDLGTAFKMNTDGTGFALLHSFAGSVSDGRRPIGSLTLSGSTLYGMTSRGGSNDAGTAFQMNTDGTGFALLHSFAGSDGRNPNGSLTLDGSTLYGMTTLGGGSGFGTAFSIGVVPEPSSMGLVLLGVGLIGWRRLRFRRES
jgi:uncharacterized repeat protein (TIGR03803 family)